MGVETENIREEDQFGAKYLQCMYLIFFLVEYRFYKRKSDFKKDFCQITRKE